jgi:hypothetical protein
MVFKHKQIGVPESSATILVLIRWMKRSNLTPLDDGKFIWDDLSVPVEFEISGNAGVLSLAFYAGSQLESSISLAYSSTWMISLVGTLPKTSFFIVGSGARDAKSSYYCRFHKSWRWR